VAADFYTGDEVVLQHGSVWESTRASSSIPGFFPPMSLHGRLLIDGGVVSPVPCHVARAIGSDIVIGVSLDIAFPDSAESSAVAAVRAHRKPTWPEVLLRAYDTLQRSFAEMCLHDADVPIRVLTPPLPLTNFDGGPRFVEAGERAVEAAADQLRAHMPWIGK
jgi:NTE family protein